MKLAKTVLFIYQDRCHTLSFGIYHIRKTWHLRQSLRNKRNFQNVINKKALVDKLDPQNVAVLCKRDNNDLTLYKERIVPFYHLYT